MKALHAKTPRALERIKSQMPPEVAANLARVKDEEQYLAAGPPELRGKSTRNYTESGSAALKAAGVRGLHPVACLKKLVENIATRFNRNKAAALSCDDALPPRVAEKMRQPVGAQP